MLAGLLLVLLTGPSGCCCGSAPTETVLAVPSSVEEARALHAPPAVAVVVKRELRPVGGGGCGSSPVCLVLLPWMVWQAAFPPEVDVVDITEATGATVHGEWEPDGDLIWAERRESGVAHAARLLDLPELGRRLVVEGGRATLGPDGSVGPFVPTLVQSQVDLVGAYSRRLEAHAGGHGSVLREAVGALGVEAIPLVESWLPRPEEVEGRREVLSLACGKDPTGDARTVRLAVLRATAPNAEPEIAASGVECSLSTPGSPEATEFATKLVAAVCADASGARSDDVHRLAQIEAAGPVLDLALATCTRPTRHTLLLRAAGKPAPAADVRAVVENDPEAAAAILPFLDARQADDRAALFAHLPKVTEIGPAAERLRDTEGLAPTAAEADILVDAYLRYEPSLLGRRDPQGMLLLVLARTAPADRGPARARLAGVTDEDRRVERDAARFVLGERSLGASLFSSLRGAGCEPGSMIVGTHEVAAFALSVGGCTCEDFSAWSPTKGAALPACLADPE